MITDIGWMDRWLAGREKSKASNHSEREFEQNQYNYAPIDKRNFSPLANRFECNRKEVVDATIKRGNGGGRY